MDLHMVAGTQTLEPSYAAFQGDNGTRIQNPAHAAAHILHQMPSPGLLVSVYPLGPEQTLWGNLHRQEKAWV